jgi:hypothetical protein
MDALRVAESPLGNEKLGIASFQNLADRLGAVRIVCHDLLANIPVTLRKEMNKDTQRSAPADATPITCDGAGIQA